MSPRLTVGPCTRSKVDGEGVGIDRSFQHPDRLRAHSSIVEMSEVWTPYLRSTLSRTCSMAVVQESQHFAAIQGRAMDLREPAPLQQVVDKPRPN